MKFYDYDPYVEAIIKIISEYSDRIKELLVILDDPFLYDDYLEAWR